MRAIRTLVVTVSPLLSELVTSVLQPHLELELVGVMETRERLEERLRALAPDLVLLGLEARETDAVARGLLSVLPKAEIVALAPDGRHAWLHELREHRTVLTNLTAPALIDALAARFEADAEKA